MDDAVEERVVADEGQNTFAVFANIFLTETNELDIVVGEWLNITLVEVALIAFQKVGNPRTVIVAANAVRWVAHHHHDGAVALYAAGVVGFLADGSGEEGASFGVELLEAVGV